jgi:hypothetical protein
VVKYRRHSLVFAKTNRNPAAAGEPPLPGAIIAAHRSKTSPGRRGVSLSAAGTWRWKQPAGVARPALPRQLSRFHREGLAGFA